MTQDFLQKMQQRYEELTGIPADEASDIGIRLRILACLLYTSPSPRD